MCVPGPRAPAAHKARCERIHKRTGDQKFVTEKRSPNKIWDRRGGTDDTLVGFSLSMCFAKRPEATGSVGWLRDAIFQPG